MKRFYASVAFSPFLLLAPVAVDSNNSFDLRRQRAFRELATGDFAEFNTLFQDAVISIPGTFETDQKVAFIELNLTIWNIQCFGISVGNVNVSHSQPSNQQIDVNVDVSALDLNCDMDYHYKYGVLHGTGKATITTTDNSASTTIQFQSEDFSQYPPNGSGVSSCSANIQITHLDFQGDFLSDLLQVFQRFIYGTIDREVEKVACDELSSLGTSFVEETINIAQEKIQPYLIPMGTNVTDPLYPEQNLRFPSGLTLLNFLNKTSPIGSWFNLALQEISSLLGTMQPDPGGPLANDLGINVFLRKFFLQNDRSFTVDMAAMNMNPILFRGNDRLTETTMTLHTVKVFGLDTFTKFDSLQEIGKYTLQNQISWDYLSAEFHIELDVKPSNRSDAILTDPNSNGFVENIRVDFAIDNVDVVASLLLEIDELALGALQLGPLLHSSNIMPCLLSVVHNAQVAGLNFNVGNISEPTLYDFISPGIDRVITDSVKAAYAMYLGVLMKAIPAIFQTSIRNVLNKNVITKYLKNSHDSGCLQVEAVEEYVDFRDLLLPPAQSQADGGSGRQQYGDLAYTLFELVQNQVLSPDSNGFLAVNNMLRTMTEKQSGTPGTLQFPSEIVSFAKTGIQNNQVRSFMDKFELKLSDARLENLDIFKSPASILLPTDSPYELGNLLTMGPATDRPLNLTVGVQMVLDGTDSPLSMNNTIDLSIALPSAMINTSLFMTVVASKLLHFPLHDILDYNCWLATIPAPETIMPLNRSEISLGLYNFVSNLSALDMGVNIVSATSAGVAIMPDLLYSFRMSGGFSKLSDRINSFADELFQGDYIQTQFDRLLIDAPKFCPHSSEYNSSAIAAAFRPAPLRSLTPIDVDTFMFTSSIVSEIAFMVFAESHRLSSEDPTSALSAQQALKGGENLINWMNMTGVVGSLFHTALSEARSYLGGTRQENGKTDLGINFVVRDYLLGGNSSWSLQFDNASFGLPGIEISLSGFKVSGLDSFSNFAIWEPIAPQTVLNTLAWEKLSAEVIINVRNTTTSETVQTLKATFGGEGVVAKVPFFLAIDLKKLGSLQLGSLMNVKDILPCLLSALQDFEITQMLASVATLDTPRFEGLMSDTSTITSAFTEQIFSTYRSEIIQSLPKIFDSTVRKLFNNVIVSYTNTSCPLVSTSSRRLETAPSPFIDFRDLLLPAKDAIALGGSGTSPYGDLLRTILGFVENYVLKIDPATGLSAVNHFVVDPLTSYQSNQTGSLLFPGNIFNKGAQVSVSGLNAKTQLRAGDIRIENLDTVGLPLAMLEAVMKQPNELNNTATFGVADRSVRLSGRLLISLLGDGE